MDQANPEAEVMNVVTAISDNDRAKAIDAIQDMLYARATDAMGSYKQDCVAFVSPHKGNQISYSG